MIKAVIFDAGDVLVTSSPILEDFLQEFDLSREEMIEYYEQLLGRHGIGEIDEKEFWRLFSAHFNIKKPIPEPSPLIRTYKQEIRRKENTLKIVSQLKENGYKLGLLSYTIPAHAEHMRKLGVFKDFDVIILSCEVGLNKPAKEIYQLTLEKLGVLPKEAVFIDNDQKNVEGAEKVGIYGIMFQNADQLKAELAKLNILFR